MVACVCFYFLFSCSTSSDPAGLSSYIVALLERDTDEDGGSLTKNELPNYLLTQLNEFLDEGSYIYIQHIYINGSTGDVSIVWMIHCFISFYCCRFIDFSH
jgi:hypothetical protein